MTKKMAKPKSPFKRVENLKKLKINRHLVNRVLGVVDAGLVRGLGTAKPGKMCVEAAICYALGLPHDDNPKCVGASVRSFKINLNDLHWPSNKARAKGMRDLAVAQLGSNKICQENFAMDIAKGVIPLLNLGLVEHGYNQLVLPGYLSHAGYLSRDRTIERLDKYRSVVEYFMTPTWGTILSSTRAVVSNTLPTLNKDNIIFNFHHSLKNLLSLAHPKTRIQYLQMAAQIGLDALKESPGYKFVPKD